MGAWARAKNRVGLTGIERIWHFEHGVNTFVTFVPGIASSHCCRDHLSHTIDSLRARAIVTSCCGAPEGHGDGLEGKVPL